MEILTNAVSQTTAPRRSVQLRGIVSEGYGLLDQVRELRARPRVVRLSQKPWRGGPQNYSIGVLDPGDDTIQSLHIHEEIIAPGGITDQHGHQNEAVLYMLEGGGYDVHDGQRIEWRAGDAAIVRGSCVHQHFNAEAYRPARVLAIKSKPSYLVLGLTTQHTLIEKPTEHSATSQGFTPEHWPSRYASEEAQAYSRGSRVVHHYDERIGRVARGSVNGEEALAEKWLIKPEDMPWEDSAHGKLKHVMNARMGTVATSVDIYIQEIPPGKRSGRHVHTAEEAFFVLEGSGYDLHWDVELVLKERFERRIPEAPKRLEWQAGDLVIIPSNVAHQHFNSDPANRARILLIQSRLYQYLGYGEIEQLEDAP